MEYRTLGKSGLRVSVLTMGTMTFGGRGGFAQVGSTDVDQARRQVDMCLDAGINLIDTADVYSGGLAEDILGEVLRGRRDDVLVATKVRMTMGRGPNDAGLSRHHVITGCEASLRRLGTDHIDLYQVHEWDGQTPLGETLAALDLLVSAGVQCILTFAPVVLQVPADVEVRKVDLAVELQILAFHVARRNLDHPGVTTGPTTGHALVNGAADNRTVNGSGGIHS